MSKRLDKKRRSNKRHFPNKNRWLNFNPQNTLSNFNPQDDLNKIPLKSREEQFHVNNDTSINENQKKLGNPFNLYTDIQFASGLIKKSGILESFKKLIFI